MENLKEALGKDGLFRIIFVNRYLYRVVVAPPQQQQQSGSSSNGSVATSVPTDAGGAGAGASRRSSLRKNDVNAFLHELQLEQNMHR